jgi:hypothetical protein
MILIDWSQRVSTLKSVVQSGWRLGIVERSQY